MASSIFLLRHSVAGKQKSACEPSTYRMIMLEYSSPNNNSMRKAPTCPLLHQALLEAMKHLKFITGNMPQLQRASDIFPWKVEPITHLQKCEFRWRHSAKPHKSNSVQAWRESATFDAKDCPLLFAYPSDKSRRWKVNSRWGKFWKTRRSRGAIPTLYIVSIYNETEIARENLEFK